MLQLWAYHNRERVFFLATRLDFDLFKINLHFNYEPVTVEMALSETQHTLKDTMYAKLFSENAIRLDKTIGDINARIRNKPNTGFSHPILHYDDIAPTVLAGHGDWYIYELKANTNEQDFINFSTFPQNYNFDKVNTHFVLGMSVPPIMIKRIVTRIIESGVFNETN